MSRSLNKVSLIGNLGADPEVRSTSGGTRVANLSVATSRRWTSASGEQQEKTEWHRVVLWNTKFQQLADVAEKYLKKGDKVFVEGRLEYRTWEDRDGNTRYSTEINARELIMLGRSGAGETSPMPAAARAASGGNAKSESFEDFPESLDEEEDDLPF